MPNYNIGDTPVQIAQSGGREALLRNVGSTLLYVEENSTVSSTAYGVALQPFDSINWPADRSLWIVSGPGDVNEVTVLYGAEGMSLGAVSAVVTGDVTATITGPVDAVIQGTVPVDIQNAVINADVTGNIIVDSGEVNVGGILTPVEVQGGGEVLLDQSGTIPGGGFVDVDVPGPADGLTYAGLAIIVSNNSTGPGSNGAPLAVYIRNVGIGAGLGYVLGLCGSAVGSLGEFGAPTRVGVAVPVGTSFPIRVEIDNGNTASKGYHIIAIGLSYTDNIPRDFGQWENGIETEISFDSAAASSFAAIAPSFETRQYLLVSVTGTAGNFVVEALSTTGTWSIVQNRAHNNLYGGNTGAAGVQANTNSLITIPGNGRIHRIRNTGAVTGSVRLSTLGIK